MSMNKKKVTAYLPEELNTRMWTHINQTSEGSSTYGAVSNFITNAVTNYLAEPYHAEFIRDNYILKTEEDDEDV